MRTYWQLYPAGRFAPQESQQAGADACRALLAGCGLSEGADYQIGELLHVGNNGHHNVLERGAAGRCWPGAYSLRVVSFVVAGCCRASVN